MRGKAGLLAGVACSVVLVAGFMLAVVQANSGMMGRVLPTARSASVSPQVLSSEEELIIDSSTEPGVSLTPAEYTWMSDAVAEVEVTDIRQASFATTDGARPADGTELVHFTIVTPYVLAITDILKNSDPSIDKIVVGIDGGSVTGVTQ